MSCEESELPPNPNVPISKEISALKSDIVHKICADRVVSNLAIAIKELVENSIDAEATSICVRIKAYGLESIEVTDNGKGVKEGDFEALAQSYHTSKISDFSDLDSIGTFGFRGEALSSLCRLCDGLIVVTRHESADCASKLEYDSSGKLAKKTPIAGTVGTKVTLQKLFSPLPVRRKVFSSKCQQEFNKAMQVLHAYCIITEGVRIQIYHQKVVGKDWSLLVCTQGGKLKENLGIVVGHKCLNQILAFPGTEEEEGAQGHQHFQLRGYISSCFHGVGRRTPDKQYYFINGRPCDMPKVSRIVNQIYHQYNRHQYPLIILNILTVSKATVDVNLAPDKRSIVLKSENALLELVKETLLSLFENIPNTMTINTDNIANFSSEKKTPTVLKLSKFSGSGEIGETSPARISVGTNQESSKQQEDTPVELDTVDVAIISKEDGTEQQPLSNLQVSHSPSTPRLSHQSTSVPIEGSSPLDRFRRGNFNKSSPSTNFVTNLKRPGDTIVQESKWRKMDDFIICTPKVTYSEDQITTNGSDQNVTDSVDVTETASSTPEESCCFEKIISLCEIPRSIEPDEEFLYLAPRTEVSVGDTLDSITQMMASKCEILQKQTNSTSAKFSVPIGTDTSSDAEIELQREISKDMFCKMSIIGQFNKAFILAKLEEDIFIIDQHAADEKYNFERLNKHTSKQSQRLIIPQIVDLSPTCESIFMENEDVFKSNGFEFIIDDQAEPSKKIKLTAVPTYLHSTFGLDDILDLIHQIQESPLEKIRPSRIRGILASKACRQSIMVGQTLDNKAMRKLVNNLATMDHPWNCPHGRPTMRHLINMTLAKNTTIQNNE